MEELLDKALQPHKPAEQWPRKLLLALAKLAALGEPEEVNGLLWGKVWARTGGEEDSVIRWGEVLEVVEDLRREGREVMDAKGW